MATVGQGPPYGAYMTDDSAVQPATYNQATNTPCPGGHNMHALKPTTFLLSLILSGHARADDQATPQPLPDQIAYLTSISMPTMQSACSTVYPSFGGVLGDLYAGWLPTHQAQVDRGRQAQQALLAPDQSIEQWEQDTVVAVKSQFESLPRERQEKRCFGLFSSLSNKAK
jgi:hypothetical protein